MKIKLINYIFFSLIILQSCASFNTAHINNCKKISHVNNLDSVYENLYDDSIKINYPPTLWGYITGNHNEGNEGTAVKVSFKTKKIEIDLLNRDREIINTKIIKGKLKGDYFYLNRKFMIYPFIPIVFGYTNEQHRFCLTEEFLYFDYTWNIWGFAVFGGTNSKGEKSFRFKKVNND